MSEPGLRLGSPAALALCLSLSFAPEAAALDPTRALTQYVQAVWRMEEGLPHNTIRALLQSRDGYIWLGTYGGLVRFDGVRFRVFDNRNSGLRDNEVRAMAEDHEGTIWVGTTAGGLHRLVGDRLEPHDTGIEHRTINALEVGPDGTLWIGSSGGLYMMREGRIRHYNEASGLSNPFVNAIAVVGEEAWIGTPAGLFHFSAGRAEAVALPSGAGRDVWSVLADRQGRVFVGLQSHALEIRGDAARGAAVVVRDLHLPDVWGWIAKFLKDRDGNLWIGTYGGGLYRLAGDRLDRVSIGAGFIDHRPWALWEDREGSLWVGTRSGLARLKDGPAVTFAREEGLAGDITRCVLEDEDGTMWFGTTEGLSRYRGGRFTTFTTREGLPNPTASSLLRDSRGRLWVGTGGGGIAPLDEARGRFGPAIGMTSGLPSDSVRVMAEDGEGRVWVGTDRGVAVAEKGLGAGPFRVPVELEDIRNQNVDVLFADRGRGVWIGTLSAGARRWFEGRAENPTLVGGASIGVRSFYEDQDGTLYIGTLGSGLFVRPPGKAFRRITSRDGLIEDSAWRILKDADDRLWMSSDRGVLRIRRSRLTDFLEGREAKIEIEGVVDTQDGMKSRECNGGGSLAGLIARDGRLWFPTTRGAVAIDPKGLSDRHTPPPVVIEEVVIDRIPAEHDGSVLAPAGSRDIEVHYTGLSFVDPTHIRFRYRVEGYDEGWVEAGERRVAYLSSLPPGAYRFRVEAANRDGDWNAQGAEISLRVEPRFVQTRTFKALVLLALLGLSGGALRLRTRQLLSREEELRRVVTQRTAELQEANARLALLATVDDLTGIANHRRFREFIEQEWLRCQRGQDPLSLLLCDIDDFKAYNDTYGHQAGDACLVRVARAIDDVFQRSTDLAARYGGEEFVAVLPSTEERGALAVAQTLQSAIRNLKIPHQASRVAPHVTVSIGLATARPELGAPNGVEALIAAADRALYAAKDQGRDRVVEAAQSHGLGASSAPPPK